MASPIPKKFKKKTIQISDPGKILDLVMSLRDSSCSHLQIKINTYLTEECEAELAFQVVVNSDRMEAYIETVANTALARKMKIYISHKLNDALKTPLEHSDMFTNLGPDLQNIVLPFLKATKDQPVTKKRLTIMAIPDKPFSVIVCVVAPKQLEENVATYIHESFLFVWPTLKKTINLEYECSLKQKCQQLLRVARRLFTQVASLETLLQIAMDQAKQLTKAEHCSVKLVDVERMELFETMAKRSEDKDVVLERRFPMDIGITGHVIKTGHLVNTKCAKDHPAFNENTDTLPGVECRTLLCFPIREQTGIIGVGQLINKIGDPYFDGMDEEMALAFSIYCGVCIMHSVVYQKIQEAHIRNSLANELVMYHMKVLQRFTYACAKYFCTHAARLWPHNAAHYVGDAEVSRLLECTGFHNHPHLSSLHFNPRALPLREIPCYVLRMFSDLGLDKKFQIKNQKLARFVLHVKKGYRDVPYHNWMHAFNVAQWAYAALLNYKLVGNGYFNELQMLMFVVAGLVHDLDHRGTTNSFHLQGQTTLAALYSSEGSVMERHHLAQAMCILNTEGCDILESLPRRDYDRAILLLRDFILASDLANYFRNLPDYKIYAQDYQKTNRAHASALQAMLMNAADLSDQLKDWGSVKKTAAAVLTEFFKQGDVEKSRGDLPAMMMDRDKCFIPELEIQFLNMTCIPLFTTLGKIIPKAHPCVKIIENHIERWEAAKPIFAEVPTAGGLAVLLSPELDNLIEMNLMEKERQLQEAEAERLAAEEAEAAKT